MNQCEYYFDCDPGEKYAKRCKKAAEVIAKFSYRHGEAVEVKNMCLECAEIAVNSLNRFPKSYGHSGCIL